MMSGSCGVKLFLNEKKQCLAGVDQSRKGSIDAPIWELVNFINSLSDYFTTSSCSGRIVLHEEIAGQKLGCVWLLATHDNCTLDELVEAVSRSGGDAFFKFEAFVLHTRCRRLEDAQLMHAQAVASGFRNSGITVGKSGKIIAAVRSTHSLEVPLTKDGRLLVSREYLSYLIEVANQKMEENLRRIKRFQENFTQAVMAKSSGVNSDQDEMNARARKKPVHPVKKDNAKDNVKSESSVSDIRDDAEFGDAELVSFFDEEEALDCDISGLGTGTPVDQDTAKT